MNLAQGSVRDNECSNESWDCINSISFLDQLSGIICSKGRRGVDVVLGNQLA
jgi:hypothetical protein